MITEIPACSMASSTRSTWEKSNTPSCGSQVLHVDSAIRTVLIPAFSSFLYLYQVCHTACIHRSMPRQKEVFSYLPPMVYFDKFILTEVSDTGYHLFEYFLQIIPTSSLTEKPLFSFILKYEKRAVFHLFLQLFILSYLPSAISLVIFRNLSISSVPWQ